MANPSSVPGPLEQSIREKLIRSFEPSTLSISNDSWQHRHHRAMRDESGKGNKTDETHFSVSIVSETFTGKTTMQRHRSIYSALSAEFEQGLHALSLVTKTPAEVEASTSQEAANEDNKT